MRTRGVVVAIACAAVLAASGCAGSRAPNAVAIEVTEAGFVPATITVPRGRPLVVTFTRRVQDTCASDVLFPSLHRGYDLPLGTTVRVEVPAAALRDSLRFTCTTQVIEGWIVPEGGITP